MLKNNPYWRYDRNEDEQITNDQWHKTYLELKKEREAKRKEERHKCKRNHPSISSSICSNIINVHALDHEHDEVISEAAAELDNQLDM